MISRRTINASLLAAPVVLSRRAFADTLNFAEGIAALERRHGGRLGAARLDTATRGLIDYRGDERFPLCSTFKCLAAAFVLARVDRGEENLARRVTYSKTDLVTYSPVTGKHLEDGLTVAEICEAAITLSDNTAGNLMLHGFGGPAGLTTYLRSIGDPVTRLDRRETELNEARPGDQRDTTTPSAMAGTLHKLVLGAALSNASRDQLIAWLVGSKTGDRRLRAGVPSGWRVGDKTGAGSNNATNDVAVIWPPGRMPLIFTAYYVGAQASDDERNAVLADVGRLATAS